MRIVRADKDSSTRVIGGGVGAKVAREYRHRRPRQTMYVQHLILGRVENVQVWDGTLVGVFLEGG